MMTVNEVSKLTGVSIRALQYYDKIGLLHPAEYTEAGYRLYDDTSLERLQQILLFRELEFSLKEIQSILQSPDFDRDRALDQQICLLTLKKEHIENLITFARGLKQVGGMNMDFSAFDTAKMDEYATKAKEKWQHTNAYQEYTHASIIKGISGDMLIPDRTVPITLEILILCFSLLYLMVPNFYTKLFSYFHYKISILNCWATQVIAVLSGIHLFASCIIYLFFSPLSYNTLYAMTHIIPPLIYVICIIVNHAFVKTISLTYKKMPFLRIAPICNGKIYVAPRSYQGEEPGKLDIPMEDYIYACKTDTDKYAKEVENKYSNHITGQPEPRFSLKHLVKETNGVKKTIMLYILPLNDEEQIHFTGGKFVTPEEIEMNSAQYSSFLKEEIDHLNIVTQMWEEFK